MSRSSFPPAVPLPRVTGEPCRRRLRLRPAADRGRGSTSDPDPRPERARARLGARGEELAAFHLAQHDGLEVIARNWRVALDELRGELDVVARDPRDGTLVVCEVKTRRGAAARDGAVATLSHRQQARIRRMVGVLLATGELRARQVRFDLIALDLGTPAGARRAPGPRGDATRSNGADGHEDAVGEVVLLEHVHDAW
jgi:Holliday junction resolvase-like predicted endonuclease